MGAKEARAGREWRAGEPGVGTATVREGMPSTPRGAAGVCPPQQVPGAMATAGNFPARRPEATPARLRAAKPELLSASGGAKMDAKRPPGWACLAQEPRASHPFPGVVSCALARKRSGCSRGGREPGPALLSPGASVAPSGAARRGAAQRSRSLPGRRRSADGAKPAPLGRGCRSPEDAPGTAGGWNPAPGPSAPTARVLPPGAGGCPWPGGAWRGWRDARAPLPLGAPAHAAAAVCKCTGNGVLQPHTPSYTRRGQKSGQGGWPEGKAGSGSQDPGGKNSPANRQSFSALDFWITTSISF